MQRQRQEHAQHPQRTGVEAVHEGNQRSGDRQGLMAQIDLADDGQHQLVLVGSDGGGLRSRCDSAGQAVHGVRAAVFDAVSHSLLNPGGGGRVVPVAYPVLVTDENGGHARGLKAVGCAHFVPQLPVFQVIEDLVGLDFHTRVAFGQVLEERLGRGAVRAAFAPEEVNVDRVGRGLVLRQGGLPKAGGRDAHQQQADQQSGDGSGYPQMHTLLQAAVSLPRSTIRSSFRASCPGRGWSGPGGHSL